MGDGANLGTFVDNFQNTQDALGDIEPDRKRRRIIRRAGSSRVNKRNIRARAREGGIPFLAVTKSGQQIFPPAGSLVSPFPIVGHLDEQRSNAPAGKLIGNHL